MIDSSVSTSLQSDNPPIPETELCTICGLPLVKFGTCRLYDGLTFELAYCIPCNTYDFHAPELPDGPYTHQAFTLAQIFAETGGRL